MRLLIGLILSGVCSQRVILQSLASHREPMRSWERQQALRESFLPIHLRSWETECSTVYSGITRITVTVVVIMFELTGALTYILPTMVRPYALPPFFSGTDTVTYHSDRCHGNEGCL